MFVLIAQPCKASKFGVALAGSGTGLTQLCPANDDQLQEKRSVNLEGLQILLRGGAIKSFFQCLIGMERTDDEDKNDEGDL